MNKDYKENVDTYIKIASETRSKLTALALTIIAAIYFFIDKGVNIFLLKLAFVSYVLTILLEVIAGFLKSQHYAMWIDGKIESIDYRESVWGISAERLYWVPIFTFVVGTILFITGIF